MLRGIETPRPNLFWLILIFAALNLSLYAQSAATKADAGASGNQKSNPVEPREQKHIFWVLPAFNVQYATKVGPLTPNEKFKEWAQSAYDPMGIGVSAAEAAVEYNPRNGFCGYGKGLGGYGKCFGSAVLDTDLSSFLGDYAFAVMMHQDPRYFPLGHGSFSKRTWYAFTRLFITYNDKRRVVFDSSSVAGTLVAAAASNLYYPKQQRGVGLSATRMGWAFGESFAFNEAAEYWPDIQGLLNHLF